MLEFQVGDHLYRARKLDTFKQMHVLKRIGPPLLKLLREEQAVRPEDVGVDPNLIGMEKFLAALHEMSDDELDFVIIACAVVVQRQISGANGSAPVWGPIFEPRAKAFMFEDLANLGDIMMITSNVVRDNLSGFLSIRPPGNDQTLSTRPTLAASNM